MTQRSITVAERGKPAASGAQIERHVEAVAALPVACGVVIVEHVDLGPQAAARALPRAAMNGGSADMFLVGRDQRSVMNRQALRTKKHFRGAQQIGVIALIEHIAQDEVHELIEKERRHACAFAHQRHIGRFDRSMGDEMIAERDHELPVLARIGVRDGVDLAPRSTGRRGSSSKARYSARSATQASGGGASSGRAR